MDEITVTASELEGRLESILEGLPTELIVTLPDELEATYTPEFLRAEADRRARRLVREGPGHRTGSPPQRPRRSNPHDSPKNLGVS